MLCPSRQVKTRTNSDKWAVDEVTDGDFERHKSLTVIAAIQNLV